jgi:anti-sigma regulatory factor (Ser/Thr protein kinase)
MIAMSAMEARRLVLSNELGELDRLAHWIESWAEQNLSPDVLLAIQLCLEEVVANVIMYGAAENDRLEITVELEQEPGTVVARIEDNGRQFDPIQVPPPTVAASLEAAKANNLGIHLVRNFASGMDYEHRDGRNCLTLRFVESKATSRPLEWRR